MAAAAERKKHKKSQTPLSSRSHTPSIPDLPAHTEVNFTWIDDTRTSSASGGRRGVRRTARDHDVVRRHAATVSAAARLATMAVTPSRLQKASLPSHAGSHCDSVQEKAMRLPLTRETFIIKGRACGCITVTVWRYLLLYDAVSCSPDPSSQCRP